MGKKITIDHFISEVEKRTTIYDIINRFDSGKSAKHHSGGGVLRKKLKRLVNNKDGVSQRKLAGCFKCTQSYVNRVIKSMGIQKHKKQKNPDKSDQQKEVNRAKCATLYRKYRDREWILEDENYFTKTHSTINGNDNFYWGNIDFAPANVKFFLSGSLCHPVGFQSHSSWQVGTQLISCEITV